VEIIKNKKGCYNNDEYSDNKMPTMPTTNRMIVVQMGGGKQLRNIVWQGCDDPTRDRISDCIRATQYLGRTIKHAT